MNFSGENILLSYADDNVIIEKSKEEVQKIMTELMSARKSSSRQQKEQIDGDDEKSGKSH